MWYMYGSESASGRSTVIDASICKIWLVAVIVWVTSLLMNEPFVTPQTIDNNTNNISRMAHIQLIQIKTAALVDRADWTKPYY